MHACTLFCSDTHIHNHAHAQTEWIKNTYDPKFSTQLEVEYHFERKQMLVFSIMDVDDASNPTKNAQEIGRVETTMVLFSCVCVYVCVCVCLCLCLSVCLSV